MQVQVTAGMGSGQGVRPRLWRDRDGNLTPDTGLQQLEAKHKRSFAEMMAAYDAVWMHDSPALQYVRQRVADRDATAARSQPTDLRQQQDLQHVTTPAVDDTEDPLLRGLPPAAEEDTVWRLAYKRAADKRLPRPLRVSGWQLLHAAVMVGSNRV
jgi:hypothetical protein